MSTIIETLAADGSFSNLLSLLEKAGLIDTLRGDGPHTLFAPTDEAFGRINIEELAHDPESLAATLAYHLVAGTYTSADILKEDSIVTSSGKSLTVRLEEGVPLIDNARYVKADLGCSNGVIHAIDNVFLPRMSGWYCGCC